jgi:hypothetical protein
VHQRSKPSVAADHPRSNDRAHQPPDQASRGRDMVVLTQEHSTCRARTSCKWPGAIVLQAVPIVQRFLDFRCQSTHSCDPLHRSVKGRGQRGSQGQTNRHSEAAWPATAKGRTRSFEFRKAGVTGCYKTGDRQSRLVSPYNAPQLTGRLCGVAGAAHLPSTPSLAPPMPTNWFLAHALVATRMPCVS